MNNYLIISDKLEYLSCAQIAIQCLGHKNMFIYKADFETIFFFEFLDQTGIP